MDFVGDTNEYISKSKIVCKILLSFSNIKKCTQGMTVKI